MNTTQPKQYLAATHRAVAYGGVIEWEEMPSMGRRIATHRADFEASSGFGNTWNTTMAADFDAIPPSQPFRETLSGLQMREVNEPDVFQHFFGATPVIDAN